MAYESRRVVTGNTPEGESTVLYDSQLPLLGKDAGAGARQEDRAGVAEAVIWGLLWRQRRPRLRGYGL